MKKLIPVKDYEGLYRDKESHGIVNLDERAYLEFKKKKIASELEKKKIEEEKRRINNLENRVSNVENKLDLILEKLNELRN